MKTFEMTDEVIRKKMDALSETINAYIIENGIKASAFNRFFVDEGNVYNTGRRILKNEFSDLSMTTLISASKFTCMSITELLKTEEDFPRDADAIKLAKIVMKDYSAGDTYLYDKVMDLYEEQKKIDANRSELSEGFVTCGLDRLYNNARKRADITFKEMAEQLGSNTIRTYFPSRFITPKLRAIRVIKLAYLFGVSVDEITGHMTEIGNTSVDKIYYAIQYLDDAEKGQLISDAKDMLFERYSNENV